MTPRSLVTGGAGFIGSHVSKELLKMGHDVVILDDLSGGSVENVPPSARLETGTILDRQKIEQLFKINRFDFVFHLAAYAAEGLSHFIKHFNYQNNLIGSVNLINASVNHKVQCFVFTSSIAVYGASQLPAHEQMQPRPEDSYGIAKYAVEMELEASRQMFGMNYIIFRPHNVYGEGQNIGDRYRNVIGIFMNQLMQQKPMTIFGDGTQTRAFSYIDNVAPFISRSVGVKEALNQTFNIGSDKPCSLNDLAQLTANAMGTAAHTVRLPSRHEVLHAFSAHEKFEQVFGKHPTVPLEQGLHRMAQWVKKVGAKQSKPFENIEILKNLPESWKQPR